MPRPRPTGRSARSRRPAPIAASDPKEPSRRDPPTCRPVVPAVHPPEVRVSLDAFRRIVRALRVGRAGDDRVTLSSAQLFALQQIAEHPDVSVNDVAALTFTHQSSVSVVIQRLVERGLVAKVAAGEDRRRQRLAVTAKGRRLLRRTPTAAQEHLIAAIAALPAADRRVFARSLGTIARLVSPDATVPPMFFEDDPGTGRKASGVKVR